MNRISTNLPNDSNQFYMQRRQVDLQEQQDRLSSQERLQNMRDDPVSAGQATRYDSVGNRLDRYAKNIRHAQDNHRVTEGYLREAVDIFQRVREIAVQGANGVYEPEDLQAMGREVNELLEEMVDIANASNGTGQTIFGGGRTHGDAFEVLRGSIDGFDDLAITNVNYRGDLTANRAEIGDDAFVPLNFPGNQVFWAENQQVYSTVDATNYVVQEPSSVFIDDAEIRLQEGDTAQTIIDRINASDAAVRARLDPIQDGLVIESTTPHQIWLEDGEGSVFQDLGLIQERGRAPDNIADTAEVYGGSAFDMVISLRDRLMEGDSFQVGGDGLRGIDEAMDNMLGRLGRLGALDARLEMAGERNDIVRGRIDRQHSREVDIDLAEAITDFRMMEHTHRAAVQTAARILPPTLLDFLR